MKRTGRPQVIPQCSDGVLSASQPVCPALTHARTLPWAPPSPVVSWPSLGGSPGASPPHGATGSCAGLGHVAGGKTRRVGPALASSAPRGPRGVPFLAEPRAQGPPEGRSAAAPLCMWPAASSSSCGERTAGEPIAIRMTLTAALPCPKAPGPHCGTKTSEPKKERQLFPFPRRGHWRSWD